MSMITAKAAGTAQGRTDGRIGGLLKIGELARRLGLTTRSLRYWEERGLLPAPRRTLSGMRMYGSEHVVAARGIVRLKRAGFTLERIEEAREQVRDSDTALAGMASLSGSMAAEERRLRESIAELQAMLEELTAARRCMELCDGCHGKAFDAECIGCLREASHHTMPDCLSSVLQAACPPDGPTE